MADSFYKILDKNGVEIPDHWSGRRRTYDEAKKMVDGLNKNGEHRPYTMIEINGNMAHQNIKLYTEEQVRKMLIRADDFLYPDFAHDAILSEHTPIELPSDEEIEMESEEKFAYKGTIMGFEVGAKWMKEQIIKKANEK